MYLFNRKVIGKTMNWKNDEDDESFFLGFKI
jgi:hypothetical protein